LHKFIVSIYSRCFYMDDVIFNSHCILKWPIWLLGVSFSTFIFHFSLPITYYVKLREDYFSDINGKFRLKRNPNDAILERALRRFINLLTQEVLPIHEGQRFIHSLLSLAVSYPHLCLIRLYRRLLNNHSNIFIYTSSGPNGCYKRQIRKKINITNLVV
jgi:hypothetical protein